MTDDANPDGDAPIEDVVSGRLEAASNLREAEAAKAAAATTPALPAPTADAGTETPTTTEQTATPAATEQPAPPAKPDVTQTAPETFTIKHGGREIAGLTREEVVALAQMGTDYRIKMGIVSQERKKLAAGFEQLEAERAALRAAPQPAKPDGQPAPSLDPELAESLRPFVDPLRAEVQKLAAQLSGVLTERQRLEQETAAERFVDSMRGEIAKIYPDLNPDHVLERSSALIAENATEDEMRNVMLSVARETEEWRRGHVSKAADAAVRAKEGAPSQVPSRPAAAPTKPVVPKDVDDVIELVNRRLGNK